MNVWAKTPNAVIVVCSTVVLVSIIASLTMLIALNRDPHIMLTVIQMIMSAAGIVVGSGGLLYAGAAAKQADTAATAITNGVLETKIRAALVAHDEEVHNISSNKTGQ